MLIDWTAEFDLWFNRLDDAVAAGNQQASAQAHEVVAAFDLLAGLSEPPVTETPALKYVRQSGKYPVWRTAHPYDPDVAVRLIVWFPLDRPGEVVVVLFAGDKATMGDVFYDTVGSRADAAITSYLMRTQDEGEPR